MDIEQTPKKGINTFISTLGLLALIFMCGIFITIGARTAEYFWPPTPTTLVIEYHVQEGYELAE